MFPKARWRSTMTRTGSIVYGVPEYHLTFVSAKRCLSYLVTNHRAPVKTPSVLGANPTVPFAVRPSRKRLPGKCP
jgi:hypothetical protein